MHLEESDLNRLYNLVFKILAQNNVPDVKIEGGKLSTQVVTNTFSSQPDSTEHIQDIRVEERDDRVKYRITISKCSSNHIYNVVTLMNLIQTITLKIVLDHPNLFDDILIALEQKVLENV